MKIPLQPAPDSSSDLDHWLSPKLTTTSLELEARFDDAACKLGEFTKPGSDVHIATQPIRWKNVFYALGTIAAALAGAFVALDNATQTGALKEVPNLASIDSLFELDSQLSAAVALLDAETFDALIYISHEKQLR